MRVALYPKESLERHIHWFCRGPVTQLCPFCLAERPAT